MNTSFVPSKKFSFTSYTQTTAKTTQDTTPPVGQPTTENVVTKSTTNSSLKASFPVKKFSNTEESNIIKASILEQEVSKKGLMYKISQPFRLLYKVFEFIFKILRFLFKITLDVILFLFQQRFF